MLKLMLLLIILVSCSPAPSPAPAPSHAPSPVHIPLSFKEATETISPLQTIGIDFQQLRDDGIRLYDINGYELFVHSFVVENDIGILEFRVNSEHLNRPPIWEMFPDNMVLTSLRDTNNFTCEFPTYDGVASWNLGGWIVYDDETFQQKLSLFEPLIDSYSHYVYWGRDAYLKILYNQEFQELISSISAEYGGERHIPLLHVGDIVTQRSSCYDITIRYITSDSIEISFTAWVDEPYSDFVTVKISDSVQVLHDTTTINLNTYDYSSLLVSVDNILWRLAL